MPTGAADWSVSRNGRGGTCGAGAEEAPAVKREVLSPPSGRGASPAGGPLVHAVSSLHPAFPVRLSHHQMKQKCLMKGLGAPGPRAPGPRAPGPGVFWEPKRNGCRPTQPRSTPPRSSLHASSPVCAVGPPGVRYRAGRSHVCNDGGEQECRNSVGVLRRRRLGQKNEEWSGDGVFFGGRAPSTK
ncbi:hypothetical protein EYF80_055450 [Liparis tanakae]|uniref:Uncharacterized protein n=1 Tax=Liparis tanakae TaxID=230148 RepID=A0A4Z2EZU4_9TELE|nr:hypothetical protein EYF80_055450 [Liparis tanakae]